MCTATYLKDNQNRIIFTTNRDESAARLTSPPEIHQIGDLKLLFPQDQLAGGTWVAVGERGQISCILNGAEDEGKWLGTIAVKSRGQVLLDSFKFNSVSEFFEDDSMNDANPFTLLIIHPKSPKIEVIKWNGTKKWREAFDASQPHIWSAFTLYPKEQRKQRTDMFKKWSEDDAHLDADKVWKMHQGSKENNGLLLENSPHVNTVSTTQLVLDTDKCVMRYFEVGNGQHAEMEINRVDY